MRIQTYSDLHWDVVYRPVPPLAAGVDLVIVAGDSCQHARKGFRELRATIPSSVHIVAIMGNHEYYSTCFPEELQDARNEAAEFGVTFLENDVAVFGNVRILGCTLWTDYCLHGPAFREVAMNAARKRMNDHRKITWQKSPWRRFRPFEAAELHAASVAFLEAELAKPFPGRTITLSHHAPHPRSLDSRHHAESALSPAYASCLGDLIVRQGPDVWIHGHIHCSSDYVIGNTRVLANPAGYGNENPSFNPALCFEL
jgi:Calcineurin-like phosphoesterase